MDLKSDDYLKDQSANCRQQLNKEYIKLVESIVNCINCGDLCCIPTDTIYALSCSAINDVAVQKVFSSKHRSTGKSLPIFFDSIKRIKEFCTTNELEEAIIRRCMPGALTMILNLKNSLDLLTHFDFAATNKVNQISRYAHLETSTIAARIPDSTFIHDIIRGVDAPIVGTSANLSNESVIASKKDCEEVFGSEMIFIESESIPPKYLMIGNEPSYVGANEYDIDMEICASRKSYLPSTIIRVEEADHNASRDDRYCEKNKSDNIVLAQYDNKWYTLSVMRYGDMTVDEILSMIS